MNQLHVILLYDKIVLTAVTATTIGYLESLSLSLPLNGIRPPASGSNEPETTTNRALSPIDVHILCVRAAAAWLVAAKLTHSFTLVPFLLVHIVLAT